MDFEYQLAQTQSGTVRLKLKFQAASLPGGKLGAYRGEEI